MRVTLVGRLDAGIAMGGGEVQLFATLAALRERGVDAQLWTPETADPGDLVHFFGCFPYFDGISRRVRALDIPTVYTPIFTQRGSVSEMPWKAFRHKHISRKFQKGVAEAIHSCQAICGTSDWELAKVRAYFGEPMPPMHRLPNGVDSRFACGDAALFRTHYGIEEEFVLFVGRIERDKGTLELIRAMQRVPHSLVVIGPDGRRKYAERCRAEAGSNVRFLGPIPHDDPLLAGAYAAATVFALPSVGETFCLSAAEAVVAGCPVVLGEDWYPEATFGAACTPVKRTPAAIAQGITIALQQDQFPDDFRREFAKQMRWETVAEMLENLYSDILAKKSVAT
ncbi:MAG: glycosyltransferase family 4 protein [Fimbriimonadaceae bacterium]|nr:glycosyltransferase family 4 protein [Fimbriimonadaceae bacterium]